MKYRLTVIPKRSHCELSIVQVENDSDSEGGYCATQRDESVEVPAPALSTVLNLSSENEHLVYVGRDTGFNASDYTHIFKVPKELVAISRRHLKLSFKPDGNITVTDMNSFNGVFVVNHTGGYTKAPDNKFDEEKSINVVGSNNLSIPRKVFLGNPVVSIPSPSTSSSSSSSSITSNITTGSSVIGKSRQAKKRLAARQRKADAASSGGGDAQPSVKDLLTKIEELERIAKINTANIKRRGSQRFHQGQVDGRSHVKSNNRARRDRGLQNGGGRSHASDFHTNGKKEICKFFRSHGRCKFGSSCRFRHVVVLSSKGDTKEKTKKLLAVIKEANKTTTTMVMAMVKIKEVVIIVTTQVVAIAAMAIVITMVATVEKKDVVVVRNFFLIFKLLIIFISIFISFLVENFQLFN